MIFEKLEIDLKKPRVSTIYAKQGESLSRGVDIRLSKDGEPFEEEEATIFAVQYKKSDGKRGFYTHLEDGSLAVTKATNTDTNGTTLIVRFAEQNLSTAGKTSCSVIMMNEDGYALATFSFIIIVEESEGYGAKSEDYFNFPTLRNLANMVGNLNDLQTANKDSLVNALNELLRLCDEHSIDKEYIDVLRQLFEDGKAGFPYAEEDLEGYGIFNYGMALIQRTEAEKKNYGSVTMPSTGKVVELIRELGSGWVDVTEDYLKQQGVSEEKFLLNLGEGKWRTLSDGLLSRVETVVLEGVKTSVFTAADDNGYFFHRIYAGGELVYEFDSEFGSIKAFGEELWRGEGGRTYVGAEEPVGAPDGSLWVVHSTESNPKGISLYYEGENEEALKNAPNGSVWLAPKSSNKPATPEGGITEETDPTVPAWAKQPQKPTYTAAEVGAATLKDIENALSDLPTGGSDKWEFIGEFNVGDEDVAEWWITEDSEGKPIELSKIYCVIQFQPAADATGDVTVYFGNGANKFPLATNSEFFAPKIYKSPRKENFFAEWFPLPENAYGTVGNFVRSFRQSALVTMQWACGQSDDRGINKQCLGGIVIAKNSRDVVIGANSTIKMWGVRM